MTGFKLLLLYITFISCKCDAINKTCKSDEDMSCACLYADLTLGNETFLNCFTEFVCGYDIDTNTFCNNHGSCNYGNGNCTCDEDPNARSPTGFYGGKNCEIEYKNKPPNPGLMTVIKVITIIVLLVLFYLIYFTYKHRNVDVVKAGSIVFTELFLFGCLLFTLGSFVASFQHGYFACVFVEWAQILGITLCIYVILIYDILYVVIYFNIEL